MSINNLNPSPNDSVLSKVFIVLGIIGTGVTWGRTIGDGTLAHLLEALDGTDGKYILPGTDFTLRDNFTGIWPLDYLLRTLVVFFWEVVDGSHPAATTTGIYFIGLLFPIIVAIYLDGLRRGNGSSILKPSLWFLIFGAAAIGCSGAGWAILYTAASPTTLSSIAPDSLRRASLLSSTSTAVLLLPAIFIGYVLPMVLMGLPSPYFVSNNFQQWTIVIWNAFPIIMYTIIATGERILSLRSSSSSPKISMSSSQAAHLRVVRLMSIVSVAVGLALHVAVTTISASAALFPALFDSKYVKELTPLSLMTPPLSLAGGDTVGDGIHGFMLWDQIIGFSLVQLVFLSQLRNALRFSNFQHRGWIGLGTVAFLLSFVVGPGTTVIVTSWLRDEILFNQTEIQTPTNEKAGKTLTKN
ncbi:uncharacterized protein N7483_002022 [Penicillium malachiteum]|uniref:uncharacterized protein n=1 Tax=Penicillium malachiteum TaxID=1324776 RepID=UPI0025497B2F|nr:uncharacterized protein N7483_002022 [Penicillium malachiteum]KAJ5736897.1 hypothetical protein N7483_002022 [Penicillium malachiteum]